MGFLELRKEVRVGAHIEFAREEDAHILDPFALLNSHAQRVLGRLHAAPFRLIDPA
jgi:hypothetical protein